MRFEPVRHARLDRGLSVAEVAQAANRSLGWIYAVERGLITPGREEAKAIATLLGAEVKDLFRRIRGEEN